MRNQPELSYMIFQLWTTLPGKVTIISLDGDEMTVDSMETFFTQNYHQPGKGQSQQAHLVK